MTLKLTFSKIRYLSVKSDALRCGKIFHFYETELYANPDTTILI